MSKICYTLMTKSRSSFFYWQSRTTNSSIQTETSWHWSSIN